VEIKFRVPHAIDAINLTHWLISTQQATTAPDPPLYNADQSSTKSAPIPPDGQACVEINQ